MMRLAVAEVARAAVRVDRRILAVVIVAAVGLGAGLTALPGEGPRPDEDLYRVRDLGSPLSPAVAAEPRFDVVASGSVHLELAGDEVRYDRSDAAARQSMVILEAATRRWLDSELADEADQAAAFPVQVRVVHTTRDVDLIAPSTEAGTGGPDAPSDNGGASGAAGSGDDADVAAHLDPTGQTPAVRPDGVDPPFPIESLLLTFAYLIPASLVTQLHAGNLHSERAGRATILLSGPLTPGQVLAGKAAPWTILVVLLVIGVNLVLGAGAWALAGALTATLLLLALSTVVALVARTTRELTLLQVGATTVLNIFLFLPPMFPSIDAVAFLSPIHLVGLDLRGEAVPLAGAAYAILPLAAATGALAALATGLMQEETLSSVRPPVPRTLQALDSLTRRPWRIFVAALLTIPFVLATEAGLVAMGAVFLIQAPWALLAIVAVVEETAKGAIVWARGGRDRSGTLVGVGFFVGEKSALLLTLVGFASLPFGPETLALLGIGGIALLTIPLALHVATSAVQAAATRRHHARLGWLVAVVIHLAYDALILAVLL